MVNFRGRAVNWYVKRLKNHTELLNSYIKNINESSGMFLQTLNPQIFSKSGKGTTRKTFNEILATHSRLLKHVALNHSLEERYFGGHLKTLTRSHCIQNNNMSSLFFLKYAFHVEGEKGIWDALYNTKVNPNMDMNILRMPFPVMWFEAPKGGFRFKDMTKKDMKNMQIYGEKVDNMFKIGGILLTEVDIFPETKIVPKRLDKTPNAAIFQNVMWHHPILFSTNKKGERVDYPAVVEKPSRYGIKTALVTDTSYSFFLNVHTYGWDYLWKTPYHEDLPHLPTTVNTKTKESVVVPSEKDVYTMEPIFHHRVKNFPKMGIDIDGIATPLWDYEGDELMGLSLPQFSVTSIAGKSIRTNVPIQDWLKFDTEETVEIKSIKNLEKDMGKFGLQEFHPLLYRNPNKDNSIFYNINVLLSQRYGSDHADSIYAINKWLDELPHSQIRNHFPSFRPEDEDAVEFLRRKKDELEKIAIGRIGEIQHQSDGTSFQWDYRNFDEEYLQLYKQNKQMAHVPFDVHNFRNECALLSRYVQRNAEATSLAKNEKELDLLKDSTMGESFPDTWKDYMKQKTNDEQALIDGPYTDFASIITINESIRDMYMESYQKMLNNEMKVRKMILVNIYHQDGTEIFNFPIPIFDTYEEFFNLVDGFWAKKYEIELDEITPLNAVSEVTNTVEQNFMNHLVKETYKLIVMLLYFMNRPDVETNKTPWYARRGQRHNHGKVRDRDEANLVSPIHYLKKTGIVKKYLSMAPSNGVRKGEMMRHIVPGHLRMQWYPSTKTHKQIWIEPYERGVGPDITKPVTVLEDKREAEIDESQ